ncbi:NAD-binding protein [Fomitopsis schrenkii]|uniref:NAD-binding protein n=1 Tax=Fomitopsis schrenkii TaxID=2126942 RepID=S8DSS5_FOMSC|nr:NAD-binding protein [Fomitopsis schrenkii]
MSDQDINRWFNIERLNITTNLHHDVYHAIDPRGALRDSCKSKSVLVTGGGRGIGKAIAHAFALAGASDVVITARSLPELEATREEILSEPQLSGSRAPKILVQVTDVTSEESVKALFDRLDQEGVEIDVLVNNAGYAEKSGPIHESDPTEWWRTWEANIKGTYLPTHSLLKKIFSTHAVAPNPVTIICTSSIGSLTKNYDFSAYQPSKAAINRFVEFLNGGYGDKGVRAFSYHPGGVMTKLAEYGMPQHLHGVLTDTAELAGGFCVFLSAPAKYAETDILKGRYLSCLWDVDDMVKRGREVAGTDTAKSWLLMELVV